MRYRDIKLVESRVYLKEGARIDHAEDIVFWEGSRGAIRALESLKSLEQGKHTNVTIKWDGSPAIIFGRNTDGEFVLTDKSGFSAKGYDGKSKSGDDLEQMFLNRSGGKNRENPGYVSFAGNMRGIFDLYERATPTDFRGYLKGDLLYYNTPPVKDKNFVFKPNIVEYAVDISSDLGKRIGSSITGVVVHRLIDEDDNESAVPQGIDFQGNDVLIFPSVTVQKSPEIEDEDINQLKAAVAKNAGAIDKLLDIAALTELKISDFAKVLYAYTNGKVDTGLENLGSDFFDWMASSKLSPNKQKNIATHIQNNQAGFDAIWQVVSGIMQIKDKVIAQFDAHDATVKANIPGHGAGGEGYVLAHPDGDIKLVPREFFTRANRAVQR
jgi:hypothetical protein